MIELNTKQGRVSVEPCCISFVYEDRREETVSLCLNGKIVEVTDSYDTVMRLIEGPGDPDTRYA